jgi:formate C-acetyltransferase
LDAQKHAEKHRDLVVRVAGYSAYFMQLANPIQDEVTNYSEQVKAA